MKIEIEEKTIVTYKFKNSTNFEDEMIIIEIHGNFYHLTKLNGKYVWARITKTETYPTLFDSAEEAIMYFAVDGNSVAHVVDSEAYSKILRIIDDVLKGEGNK